MVNIIRKTWNTLVLLVVVVCLFCLPSSAQLFPQSYVSSLTQDSERISLEELRSSLAEIERYNPPQKATKSWRSREIEELKKLLIQLISLREKEKIGLEHQGIVLPQYTDELEKIEQEDTELTLTSLDHLKDFRDNLKLEKERSYAEYRVYKERIEQFDKQYKPAVMDRPSDALLSSSDKERAKFLRTCSFDLLQTQATLEQLELDSLNALLSELVTRIDEQSLKTEFSQAELDQVLVEVLDSQMVLREKFQGYRDQVLELQESVDQGKATGDSRFRLEHLRRTSDILEKRVDLSHKAEGLWRFRYKIWNQELPMEELMAQAAALKKEETLFHELDTYYAELFRSFWLEYSQLIEQRNKLPEAAKEELESLNHRLKLVQDYQYLVKDFSRSRFRVSQLMSRSLEEAELFSSSSWGQVTWLQFKNAFKNIWNLELYQIEDRVVTVQTIVIAVLIFIIGVFLARKVVVWGGDWLSGHVPMRESVQKTIERMSYYALIILLVLFTLQAVNIPLTVFTLLGGTLAIAFGFGAQNILNNFISGIILMIERPVAVGDLVEVQGTVGIVEEIGARSTLLRGFSGIHEVVPNSQLLENKVTNWTLQDNQIRTTVKVGVAYGSDIDQVRDILLDLAKDEVRILRIPEPQVTFVGFGDSSLDFEVFFWLSFRNMMDKRQIESHLRGEIYKAFRRENIVIPFPQRDVHLIQKPAETQTHGEENSSDSL